MSANRRRKVFDKHLMGFVLGESSLDDVRDKLGKPANTMHEDKVKVLEYNDPAESSIASFKKVQFIFYDDLLLNVSYVEPRATLTRDAVHKVLGQPDDTPEEDDEDDDEEGESEIFDVDVDEEPMLSFATYYVDDKVEALSLCAEISEDLLDEDEEDGPSSDDERG